MLLKSTSAGKLESEYATKVFSAIIVPDEIVRHKGAKAYPEPKLLTTEWISSKPSYIDLEISELENSVDVLHESDYSSIQLLNLEIEHTGNENLRELTLLIEWLRKDSSVYDEKTFEIIKPENIEFEPQSKLIYHINEVFYPDSTENIIPFTNYRIKIKNAQ